MRGVTILGLAALMVLAAGCASITVEARTVLDKPVNCETAEQDIAELEGYKASIAKRVGSGVRSVLPIAVVVGILRGDMRDRMKVASGGYNKEIDAKIAEIQQKCGTWTP